MSTNNDLTITDDLVRAFGAAELEIENALSAARDDADKTTRLKARKRQVEAAWSAFQGAATMDTVAGIIDTAIKFAVGKTYTCRSIGDSDCIYSFTIVRRSEKTVTINYHDKEVRRTIRVVDGSEQIDPHGRYSMSPVLRAKPYGDR